MWHCRGKSKKGGGESPANHSLVELELSQVAQDVLDEILHDLEENKVKIRVKIGENEAPIRIGS